MDQPHISAEDLGITLKQANEKELFKWFLASYLFGKRIQQKIARNTWKVFMRHGLDEPQKIHEKTWQELVDLLGEGGYVRYDESTASYLLDATGVLAEKYDGKILNMYKESKDRKEFTTRLHELKGVGPKTVEIFMREAESVLFGSSE